MIQGNSEEANLGQICRISQNHQAPGARNRDDRQGLNALRLGVCHPAGASERSRETCAWTGICAACSWVRVSVWWADWTPRLVALGSESGKYSCVSDSTWWEEGEESKTWTMTWRTAAPLWFSAPPKTHLCCRQRKEDLRASTTWATKPPGAPTLRLGPRNLVTELRCFFWRKHTSF